MFTNLSFKQKILSLLILPLSSFLWMSITSVIDHTSVKNEMTELAELTKISVVYSDLVHELQKERGATAGFIGSKGKAFQNILSEQRKLTNNQRKKRDEFWQNIPIATPVILNLHKKIDTQIDQLSRIRAEVDSQKLSLQDALAYYTTLNSNLLSASKVISLISKNSEITKEMLAYYNFLQAKERAGIERAVLSNVFAVDTMSPELLIRFIKLISEQNIYFNSFKDLANKTNNDYFNRAIQEPAVLEVERLRAIAMKKSLEGKFEVDASYWFKQATIRITHLKDVENKLSESVIELAHTISKQASKSLIISIIVLLSISVLLIAICLAVIKNLDRRISDLLTVLNTVREQNDLTPRTKYNDKSELGNISNAVNLTLENFSGALSNITSASTSLSLEAQETATTSESSYKNIEQQQTEIALVASAIEELSTTVKEVAANIQGVSDAAKKTDDEANDGLEIVKKSYQSIEELAQEISDLSVRISSLHESSLNITNIVDVIKSVADQTNLLALNAAIEAARAGDQGRGFAVVADEVRTLAQRTQDSTNEIENFINELQGNANSAFGVIENSQNKANQAVENSKNVEQVLTNITDSVGNIFSLTEQVACAIKEQLIVTDDVAQNIVRIEDKSQQSVAGAKQIVTLANHQAKLALSLLDTTSTFKIDSETMSV